MGSNTEKKPWTNLQNSSKNWSKEIKSDNFCYCKVGRAITKWGAIEKSPIFQRVTKLFRILMVAIIFSSTVHCTVCLKSDKYAINLSVHIVCLVSDLVNRF